MGTRFLIDTNAVIDYLKGALPPAGIAWLRQIFDQQAHALSVITRIELLSRQGEAQEMRFLTQAISESTVLGLDEPVILETIRIRQQYRRKLPDAIIAATALVHRCEIITRNVADFQAITGLVVIDPHDTAILPLL